ncbi:MAG TPA: sulfatase-like hydrolase/transferase [Terriglobales bacterium]|jgi:hypothetical protein|nr:sulfatase-like hydrolase/transferase [Terriglobales bacterium]
MKVKYLLEGCGIAILVLLSYIWPQVSPNHVAIYFSVLPVTSVTSGILIDVVALAAISTLVITLASRGDGDTNGRYVWVALMFVAISAAVSSIAKLAEVHRLTPNSAVLAGGMVLPVCLTRYWSPLKYKVLVRGFRLALALIGLCAIWIIPQLLFIALHRQSSDQLAFRKPTGTNIPLRRIVWILFDELSYAQTFESRNSSLRLPNFDWLRDRSTSFSQLGPVGYYTARVVPSLLIGRQIRNLRSTLDGSALIQLEESSHLQQLDPQQTIFAEAQRNGWTTGVAGWSNPYCRLLSTVLDSCDWLPDQFTPSYLYSHMSAQRSPLQNALAPVANSIRRFRHQPSADPSATEFHLRDARDLIAPALALIRDEQIGFVFLHLAVPHPPGVYDRSTHQFRKGGSYLDNLALADHYLGQLLEAVSSTTPAARTTVVVCSDHSWRVPMWKNSAIWTQEDERASNSFFDNRPVLMVHFPEQTQRISIDQPENSLILHAMLEGMLRGTIADPEQLASWVAAW